MRPFLFTWPWRLCTHAASFVTATSRRRTGPRACGLWSSPSVVRGRRRSPRLCRRPHTPGCDGAGFALTAGAESADTPLRAGILSLRLTKAGSHGGSHLAGTGPAGWRPLRVPLVNRTRPDKSGVNRLRGVFGVNCIQALFLQPALVLSKYIASSRIMFTDGFDAHLRRSHSGTVVAIAAGINLAVAYV